MPDLSKWNVLVVDDEPDNIGVIELVLRFHNAKVRTAASGSECFELMMAETPTLLLVDIQMPEMSGFELLTKVREADIWRHIPTIAITAHAMAGDEERILAAGFDGYIAKPINAMSLADELTNIVNARTNE